MCPDLLTRHSQSVLHDLSYREVVRADVYLEWTLDWGARVTRGKIGPLFRIRGILGLMWSAALTVRVPANDTYRQGPG